MKITDIKTFMVDFGDSNYVFVKIYTDEGVEGVGEATLEGIDHPSVFDWDLEDIGRVLMLGKFNDDPTSPRFGKFDNGGAPARLLFQPSSSAAPQWPSIPEGFWQPRWHDDAYGFVVSLTDDAKWAEIDAENDAVVSARWGE